MSGVVVLTLMVYVVLGSKFLRSMDWMDGCVIVLLTHKSGAVCYITLADFCTISE